MRAGVPAAGQESAGPEPHGPGLSPETRHHPVQGHAAALRPHHVRMRATHGHHQRGPGESLHRQHRPQGTSTGVLDAYITKT